MRTCYVSIPWGVRPDQVGRSLDFDYLYRAVLYPAIQEVEMQCYRLEDLITAGSHWQKQLFTALMSSDLMIADVSTSSANVLYELGIRHALRRGRTIVISASGERIPSNLAELRTLYYEPDGSGCLTGESAAHFRQALQSTIRQSQRTAISDSPIYQYFPGLEVILPPELAIGGHRRQRTSTNDLPGFAQSGLMSSSETTAGVQKTEQEIRSASDPDPVDYLKLLSRYRDLSDWDSFITLATDAPPTVGASPEVRQSLALALNRRAESSGEPSDQARAIAIMTQLIDETGGDSESFGPECRRIRYRLLFRR